MSATFHTLSAVELVRGLQAGRWSSVELTRHFLDRIKDSNPHLHAVPILLEEEALQQARESDARRAQGKPLSTMDGLPMTVKDAIRMKGVRSTYGMWMFKNHRPRTDARLIQVLREAGMVFLGRSAVPTGAFDWNCRNEVYAECVNPIDPTRTPGGSSGGAAAALAAGLTPLELGSDLGGSIRYPAHCCGIYGLRTTDGSLPVNDIGPEGFPAAFKQLVSLGPMAKTAADLDLLLDLYVNKSVMKTGNHSSRPLNFSVAYSTSLMGVQPEPRTRELLGEYLKKLERRGHKIVEAAPFKDAHELYRVWGLIAGYENSAVIPRLLRTRALIKIYAWWTLKKIGPGDFAKYFRAGLLASAGEYLKACDDRARILKTADEFFEKYPLWILPVAPSAAIPLEYCGKPNPTPGGPVGYSAYLGSYTVPTTTLGTPVLTCPIGADEAGLPIGVQIHGPRFADRWLVRTVSEFLS